MTRMRDAARSAASAASASWIRWALTLVILGVALGIAAGYALGVNVGQESLHVTIRIKAQEEEDDGTAEKTEKAV